MQVKKQQLEPDMEQQTGSKQGKEYVKVIYYYPANLTYMQSISYEMPGWMKHKLESRVLEEISITSNTQITPSPYGRRWRTKESLDESERGEWESWLKIQHSKKTDITASGPITSQQIDGKKVETVSDFIFLGSKMTVDGDCSHEIKKRLLLRRKAMTNLDSVLKSWDITLPTKVCIVKAMVFPVVMYGCDSCTIKKAECQRIDAFELWCWRRLLDSKEIKPVNPKGNQLLSIHWKDWCWSWSSKILATCCEALTHWKRPWCRKDWRQEEQGTTEDEMVGWHHWLNGHESEQTLGDSEEQGSGMLQFMRS